MVLVYINMVKPDGLDGRMDTLCAISHLYIEPQEV